MSRHGLPLHRQKPGPDASLPRAWAQRCPPGRSARASIADAAAPRIPAQSKLAIDGLVHSSMQKDAAMVSKVPERALATCWHVSAVAAGTRWY